MRITKELHGHLDQQPVHVFCMEENGLKVEISEYGATILGIYMADYQGKEQNMVLRLDSLEEYVNNDMYLGAVCGRNANRIAGGCLNIQNRKYQMDKNENNNSLHSGPAGFDKRVFAGKVINNTLVFSLFSPHMDQGLPGNMEVEVTYSLNSQKGLNITYKTTSDMDTVSNLTNHAYFNLGDTTSILDHYLSVAADYYTPIDQESIPTGEILAVANTSFNFTESVKISQALSGQDMPNGCDHNFVLRGESHKACATLYAPDTKISMDVFTSLPGLQVYTGNYLCGKVQKNHVPVEKNGAICLETQYFPNAFDFPHFEKPIVKAGETKIYWTEYRFSL